MWLGGKNLLQIYRERLEIEAARKHVEFAGRRNLGEIAKLYIKMDAAIQEASPKVTPVPQVQSGEIWLINMHEILL